MRARRCRLLACALVVLAAGAPVARGRAGGQGGRLPEGRPADAAGSVKPPPGWKRHELKNTNGDVISVLLPRQPDNFPGGKLKSPTGHTLAANVFMVAADAKFYFVVFVDELPVAAERMTEVERADLLHDCWMAVAAQVRQALREKYDMAVEIGAFDQRARNLNGREGREQRFFVGANEGCAQMILADRSAYLLVGIWPQDAPVDEHTPFFQSFEVRRARSRGV